MAFAFQPTAKAASAQEAVQLGVASALGHGVLAIAGSLVDRLRRLEGALLAVNLSLIALAGGGVLGAALLAVVSALTLTFLYAYNDFWDAEDDRLNPRKNQRLVEIYLAGRACIAALLAALFFCCASLAYLAGGSASLLAVTAVAAINAAYSRAIKGMPLLDVAWCGLWGASYAWIVQPPWPLVVVVGLMTSVCHVYQTLADREVDQRNGVGTIAAATPQAVPLALAALCAALAAVLLLWFEFPWTAALSAFAPLLPYYAVASRPAGWLLAKAYFGALWLALLSTIDGLS